MGSTSPTMTSQTSSAKSARRARLRAIKNLQRDALIALLGSFRGLLQLQCMVAYHEDKHIQISEIFGEWWMKRARKDSDMFPPCPFEVGVSKNKKSDAMSRLINGCSNAIGTIRKGSCTHGASLIPDKHVGHAILASEYRSEKGTVANRSQRECDFGTAAETANDLMSTLGKVKPKVLQIYNHVQVLGLSVIVFPIKWPAVFTTFANSIRNVFNDFFVTFISLNCGINADVMAFFYLYAFALPLTFILIVIAEIVYFYSSYYSSETRNKFQPIQETGIELGVSVKYEPLWLRKVRCWRRKNDNKKAQRGLQKKTWKYIFLAVEFLYVPVSGSVFKFFQCREFQEPSPRSYLRADMRVMCFKQMHAGNNTLPSVWDDASGYQWACFWFIVIGIPVAQFAYMAYYYFPCCYDKSKEDNKTDNLSVIKGERDKNLSPLHDTNHPSHATLDRRLGSLYKPFKNKFWYVSVLEKIHQLLLTGFLNMWNPDDQPVEYAMAGILISFVWLLFMVVYLPYKARFDNLLQIMLKSQTILNLVVGLANTAYERETFATGKDRSHAFDLLIVSTNTTVLCIALAMFFASVSDLRFFIYRFYYFYFSRRKMRAGAELCIKAFSQKFKNFFFKKRAQNDGHQPSKVHPQV